MVFSREYTAAADRSAVPPASGEERVPYAPSFSRMGALRFLKGVTIYHPALASPLVGVSGRVTELNWRNVGGYVEQVENEEQARALVSLLHPHYSDKRFRLDSAGLSSILREIPRRELPLTVVQEHAKVEAKTLARGLFRERGMWFVHFLIIEGTVSVVEYKYVVGTGNRVAGLRRVIVKGPENPSRPGEAAFSALSSEKQAAIVLYSRCCEFLHSHAIEKCLLSRSQRPAPVEEDVEE
jgi:hypothetical protein